MQSTNFRGVEDVESFLSSGERQSIIQYLLNSIRAEKGDEVGDVKFREGEAISKELCLLRFQKLNISFFFSSDRGEPRPGHSGLPPARQAEAGLAGQQVGGQPVQAAAAGRGRGVLRHQGRLLLRMARTLHHRVVHSRLRRRTILGTDIDMAVYEGTSYCLRLYCSSS